jgi:hypothetical protein
MTPTLRQVQQAPPPRRQVDQEHHPLLSGRAVRAEKEALERVVMVARMGE